MCPSDVLDLLHNQNHPNQIMVKGLPIQIKKIRYYLKHEKMERLHLINYLNSTRFARPLQNVHPVSIKTAFNFELSF